MNWRDRRDGGAGRRDNGKSGRPGWFGLGSGDKPNRRYSERRSQDERRPSLSTLFSSFANSFEDLFRGRTRSTGPGRRAETQTAHDEAERLKEQARWRRVLTFAGLGAATVVGIPLVLLFAVNLWGLSLQGLPELRAEMDPGRTVFFTWSDNLPMTWDRPRLGRKIDVHSLPEYVKWAFIDTEDRDFYRHNGVSGFALMRAAIADLRSGQAEQGGSTITQQLAKNVILRDRGKTGQRKLKEMLIARNIERDLEAYFTNRAAMKDQLLGFYLASNSYGTGARGKEIFGLELASMIYFGKPPAQLRPYEAAMLAGLVNAPGRLNPCRNLDRARRRTQFVLANMLAARHLSRPDYDQALVELSASAPKCDRDSANIAYVMSYILTNHREMLAASTTGQPFAGDITIRTTLDKDTQAAAEKAVQEEMRGYPGYEVAFVAMDGHGRVRALLGGRDYGATQYNRAAPDQPLQVGSVFKTFIYLSALEHGARPDDLCRNDGGVFQETGSERYVVPSGGHGLGEVVTLRDAFAASSNVVAMRVAYTLGYGVVTHDAEQVGFKSRPTLVSAWPLVATAKPLDLAAALAPLANGGYVVKPLVVEPATLAPFTGRPTVASSVLADLANMGLAVVNSPIGTGRNAAVSGLTFGGKTGTTNRRFDAWFVAFGQDFVVVVWMGHDRPRAGADDGGGAPARIVARFLGEQKLGWGKAPGWPLQPAPAGPRRFLTVDTPGRNWCVPDGAETLSQ